jgi:hypothetical protein
MGFYFEANAVAGDVVGGRNENSVVPLQESVRMMRVVDEIRKQGGVVYPQDERQFTVRPSCDLISLKLLSLCVNLLAVISIRLFSFICLPVAYSFVLHKQK